MRADNNPTITQRTLFVAGFACLLLSGCASTPAPKKNTKYVLSPSPDYALSPTEGLDSAPPRLHALLTYYNQWAGVPYRYGGTNKNGIDCSAFVKQTMASVSDLSLPRTTRAQAQRGRSVALDDLNAGDLVFFRTSGGNRHVGIYIGDDRFMHASSSVGVTISNLDNS